MEALRAHNPYVAGFEENTVFSGLTLPIAARFAPDGRVFVAEKAGIVKAFDSIADTTPTTVLDISSQLWGYHDHGLLGLAVDSEWPTRPYIYIFYAMRGSPGGRISRIQVDPATNLKVGNEVVLVEAWCQIYASHGVGDLNFGPDGALYATAGDGASFNFVDWGQEEPHNEDNNPLGPCTCNDPPLEGGTLRSQDMRTTGDPLNYNGALIRIDPDSGAALPDNPLIGGSTADDRVIAYGMRNPFRFTVDPSTNSVYICDVGWNTWEEINRIADPLAGPIPNFGWPCYEGPAELGAYYYSDLPICNALYADESASAPFYTFQHVSGSSVTGVAIYQGGQYPAQYDGALFWADYTIGNMKVMYPDVNGVPDPNTIETFADSEVNAVDLQIGPNGDLFYVHLPTGTVRHIVYVAGTNSPDAVIAADVTNGLSPLPVQFSAAGSTDPQGSALTYEWDFDNDGDFSDSTEMEPLYTFQSSGNYVVTLRVTNEDLLSDTDSIVIAVDNGYPTATIDTPASTLVWRVGDEISFAGTGFDPDSGVMPAGTFTWNVMLDHCTSLNPPNCHQHTMETLAGVSSGTFFAIDHEYPCQIELNLTVTEPGPNGLSHTDTIVLLPDVVTLTMATSPAGLQAGIYAEVKQTPFAREAVINGVTSVVAPSPQFAPGVKYTFTSWSDGGAFTHAITIPATNTTYTANFNANQQPVLAAIGNKSVNEGVLLQIPISASDPDGTMPVLSATNLPAGATLTDNGNGTGTINWTPTFSQAGTFSNITVKAADRNDAQWWDVETISITVNNVNRAPTINADGAKSVDENTSLQFQVTASDPDGTIPALSASNLPSGATFVDNGTGTGTFTWATDYADAGTYNNVVFTATDNGTPPLNGTDSISITVININRPPSLAAITGKTVNENSLLQFSVSATDPDSDTLTLSAANLPTGASFADNGNGSGTFTWTPGFTASGTYSNIGVTVSDGQSPPLTDQESFSVTVNNVNRAPVLAAIGPKTAFEGQLLSFVVSATDPDNQQPQLTAANLPLGATFVPNGNGTATFSWQTNFTDAGIFPNVTFTANDNDASPLTDSESIAVTITNVNRAPVIAAIANQNADEGESVEITVTATDADGTVPALSASNLPDGATFTDLGNGSGSFVWQTAFDDAGLYTAIKITATDAEEPTLEDIENFNVTIANVNRAPVVAPLTDVAADETSTISFTATATDADGDAVTWSTSVLPQGATFTDLGNGSGSFNWIADYDSADGSPHVVTFIADDGTDNGSAQCTIAIGNVNRPVSLNAIGGKKGTEGKVLSFNVKASDPDGEPDILADGLPEGATFTRSKAGVYTFAWLPDYHAAEISPFSVTFTATDGETQQSETIQITVKVGTSPGTITVTRPKAGQTWVTSDVEKLKIRWQSTGDTGEFVALELWQNGAFVDNIKKSTSNDEAFAWKSSKGIAVGSGYSIRVRSIENPLIYGASGTFSITE